MLERLKAFLGRKDMADDKQQEEEQRQQRREPTQEELNEAAFAQLVASGSLQTYLEKAGLSVNTPEPQTADYIPGTKTPKPMGYDDWSYEAMEDAKIKAVRAELLAEVKGTYDAQFDQLKAQHAAQIAPVMRTQALSKVMEACGSEASKQYAAKAMEETEKRFGKTITAVDPNEAWLIAGLADKMEAEARAGAVPAPDFGEGFNASTADPKVVDYMNRYNSVRPDKKLTYEQAVTRYRSSTEHDA